MSKGGGSTETTKTEPWSALQPYLKDIYSEAQGMYETYRPQFFTGQTQAGFTPDQLTAQAGIRDFATQGAPQIMNPALGAYQYGAGSSILDVGRNPYVTGAAQAARGFGLDPSLTSYGGLLNMSRAGQAAGYDPTLTNVTGGPVGSYVQSAQQQVQNQGLTNVANNPYVQGMARGAAQDAMAALQPELASIRSGAVQSGGYGGSRQGIAEGLALGGAADAATRAAADIYGQAYGQGLGAETARTSNLLGAYGGAYGQGLGAQTQRMGQTLGTAADMYGQGLGAQTSRLGQAMDLFGGAYGQGLSAQQGTLGQTGALLGAGFLPYEQLGASGAEQQSAQQALIEDAKAKWDFEQNLPYNALNQYMSTLSGTGGLLGGAGSTTSPGQSSASQAMQTAMMLRMLAGGG